MNAERVEAPRRLDKRRMLFFFLSRRSPGSNSIPWPQKTDPPGYLQR